uniref:(northern house mosquito) hypothetical protein n=1 Tax=Culex pipiens TaxID=7175 RepID=A0A8D8G857_CULPI
MVPPPNPTVVRSVQLHRRAGVERPRVLRELHRLLHLHVPVHHPGDRVLQGCSVPQVDHLQLRLPGGHHLQHVPVHPADAVPARLAAGPVPASHSPGRHDLPGVPGRVRRGQLHPGAVHREVPHRRDRVQEATLPLAQHCQVTAQVLNDRAQLPQGGAAPERLQNRARLVQREVRLLTAPAARAGDLATSVATAAAADLFYLFSDLFIRTRLRSANCQQRFFSFSDHHQCVVSGFCERPHARMSFVF